VISYNGVVDTGKVLYSGVIDTGMVILTGVNDTAERRTVAPFTLKLAKQKVKDLEGCHCTSNILGHLPTHRKNRRLLRLSGAMHLYLYSGQLLRIYNVAASLIPV
jgi:hypothetical protein